MRNIDVLLICPSTHRPAISHYIDSDPTLGSQTSLKIDIQTHDLETPFFVAVWFGRSKIVSLFIKQGVDPLIISKDGKSALDHALDKQYPGIVNCAHLFFIIQRLHPFIQFP